MSSGRQSRRSRRRAHLTTWRALLEAPLGGAACWVRLLILRNGPFHPYNPHSQLHLIFSLTPRPPPNPQDKLARRLKSVEVKILSAPRPGKKCLVIDIDYTIFDLGSTAERPEVCGCVCVCGGDRRAAVQVGMGTPWLWRGWGYLEYIPDALSGTPRKPWEEAHRVWGRCFWLGVLRGTALWVVKTRCGTVSAMIATKPAIRRTGRGRLCNRRQAQQTGACTWHVGSCGEDPGHGTAPVYRHMGGRVGTARLDRLG
jgi:hypothetical protein